MDKVLVEVYVPAENRTFDVWIPKQSKLYEAAGLLSNALVELSNGILTCTGQMVLCDRQTGIVLNINLSIKELALKHGAKLMLL